MSGGAAVWSSARQIFRIRRYSTSSGSRAFQSNNSASSSQSPPVAQSSLQSQSSSTSAQTNQWIAPNPMPPSNSSSKLTPFAAVYPFSYPRSFTSSSNPILPQSMSPTSLSHSHPSLETSSFLTLLNVLTLSDLQILSNRFLTNLSSFTPTATIQISQILIIVASGLEITNERDIAQRQQLLLDLTQGIAHIQVEETAPKSTVTSLHTDSASEVDLPRLKQARFNREYSVDDLLLDSLPTVEEEKGVQEGRKQVHEGAEWTKE